MQVGVGHVGWYKRKYPRDGRGKRWMCESFYFEVFFIDIRVSALEHIECFLCSCIDLEVVH